MVAIASYFTGLIGNVIVTVIGIILLLYFNREIVKHILKKEAIF